MLCVQNSKARAFRSKRVRGATDCWWSMIPTEISSCSTIRARLHPAQLLEMQHSRLAATHPALVKTTVGCGECTAEREIVQACSGAWSRLSREFHGLAVGDATVNTWLLVVVPPGVFTTIWPVCAPGGTLVVSCESEFTVYS